jgi:glycosyltransferase involved in cell wall biosynthesis
MNKKPSISVIMSCFKESEAILKRAIDSIINQTYKNFELIIVLDDPHNKNSKEIVENYCERDERIRMFVNPRNMRQGYSRNFAIKNAFGNFIAVQDADDVSIPKRLEIQFNYMLKNPDVDLCGSNIKYITNDNKILLNRVYPQKIDKLINKYCPIANPSVFAKREAFFKFGFYNETINTIFVEDYDLWIRWFLKGASMSNTNLSLVNYYQSKENIKSLYTKKQLRQTIKLKWNYHKRLNFSISDYLYIIAECLLLFFPSKLIKKLFYYMYNKILNQKVNYQDSIK